MGKTPSWTLSSALAVNHGEVISLVGGGGKSTTMFKLAAELADAGRRVLMCTTTHIGREQSAWGPPHLVWQNDNAWPRVQTALQQHNQLLITGPLTENGLKWGGVTNDWVCQAVQLPAVDVVLVEADGAKHLPFKAPADHEPVVPTCTTLLLPMLGIDAVNQPLATVSHRPERVSALTGLQPTDLLTPAAIAAVLAHRQGGLKGRPTTARVRVLVNKVEEASQLAAAQQIAHALLNTDSPEALDGVLIGAVQNPQPIREVRRRVAAVVLAAGRSQRMDGEIPKQLLPWKNSTVIQHVTQTLIHCSGISGPLVVVTGAHAEQIKAAIEGHSVRCVFNPHYAAGEMISSLQTALRELDDQVQACLVVLADQPWLKSTVIETLLEAYASSPAGIVAPSFQGQRGHPVLIDKRYWMELLALTNGAAPRQVLQQHLEDTLLVPVPTESILLDMDTRDDYQIARQTLHD